MAAAPVTVLTIGTFDGMHAGHQRLLERCANLGDDLLVGVNSDRFVVTYKSRAAERTERERLDAVEQAGYRAVLNRGPGIDLIRDVQPDYLAVGSDWLDVDYMRQIGSSGLELSGLGVAVVFFPRTRGVSSSELRLVR